MVKKVKKEGYTRIPDKVLEGIVKARLNGGEYACILFLIRKTYGWNKKTDKVSLSQFVLGTGYTKMTVIRSIQSLQRKQIIAKLNTKGTNNWIISPTYFERKSQNFKNSLKKYLTLSSKNRITEMLLEIVTDSLPSSNKDDTKLVTDMLHTKDTYQKTLIQKTERQSFAPSLSGTSYPPKEDDLVKKFFKIKS